jgi:hypothetical protein
MARKPMTDKELDIFMLSQIDAEALIRELHDKITFVKEVLAKVSKQRDELAADAAITKEEWDAIAFACTTIRDAMHREVGTPDADLRPHANAIATLFKLRERLTKARPVHK